MTPRPRLASRSATCCSAATSTGPCVGSDPSPAVELAAAAGTPDDSASCNISTSAPENAGSRTACVSRYGANDMVGNLREWVSPWIMEPGWNGSLSTWPNLPGGSYGDDGYCPGGTPAALDRSAPVAYPIGVGADEPSVGGRRQALGRRGRRTVATLPAVAVLCALAGCTTAGESDPCAGIECSFRGFCVAEQGMALCACIPGFHPVLHECVPNDPVDPCAGVDCSGHGDCRVQDDRPTCDCRPGYRHARVGDPMCDEVECDLVCVPETPTDGGPDDGRDVLPEMDPGEDRADADAPVDEVAAEDASLDEPGTEDTPLDEPEPGDGDAQGDGADARCGNGTPESPEECDDGNPVDGDGCDADCTFSCHAAAECDDDEDCTDDECVSSPAGQACSHGPAAAGTTCDDGNACTGSDACDATGACRGAALPADTPCEDNNDCTYADVCDAAGGCRGTPFRAGAPCDDGLYCNGPADACDGAGACVAASTTPCPVAGCVGGCDEATDSCVPAAGTVVCRPRVHQCDVAESCDGAGTTCPSDAMAPADTLCDDGIRCTYWDACDGAGICRGGGMVPAGEPCDDGNQCTSDACDGDGGCRGTPLAWGTSCDDGDPCLSGDYCDGSGACHAGSTVRGGVPCEDGDYCTTGDSCDWAGHCSGSVDCSLCPSAPECHEPPDP